MAGPPLILGQDCTSICEELTLKTCEILPGQLKSLSVFFFILTIIAISLKFHPNRVFERYRLVGDFLLIFIVVVYSVLLITI